MKKLLLSLLFITFFQMNAQLKPVTYADGTQKLNGFSAMPAKPIAGKPGILVLPAWKGIGNHSKEVAAELAKLGYYAFVADIYGEGNYPTTPKEAGERSGYYKNHPDEYQKRIKLALEQLVKAGAASGNVVVIGYCFGGTGALEAARGGLPVKGVVSFHGGLGKYAARKTTDITAKVLILHGADDPYVPQKEIEAFQNEMGEAKADWQMVYYANAVHAFTEKEAGNDNSKGAAYNEKADKRSWQHFLLFLNEIFKK